MHHIACGKSDIGKYVFLPGDPKRVPIIAKYFDKACKIADSREFVTYTGYLCGEKVSAVSTGIGGPSASIAIEELSRLGADTFIRIGTCGGISPEVETGSLVIATASIRKEGTSLQYLPVEFPAVADFNIVNALKESAEKKNYSYYMGVVESKDSYYGQHDPLSMPVSDMLESKWNCWKKGNALASEMETAALFIVAAVRNVRCGAVLTMCRNIEREKFYNLPCETDFDTTKCIEVAVDAMKSLISADK